MTVLVSGNDPFQKRVFTPKEDTYAVIAPAQKKLGRVKDIDATGVTFLYFDESHDQAPLDEVNNRHHRVDVFIKQQGYYLRDLPIKSHTDFPDHDTPSFSQLPIRKIKIEFGTLTPTQIQKLEYLSGQFHL